MSRVLCIASGKGGVGKTTTAINLGMVFSKHYKQSILMDANLTTPNVHHHLGIDQVPYNLQDALQGKVHVSEAVYKHESGLKLIPLLNTLDEVRNIDLAHFQEVIKDAKEFSEVLVLDGAAGLGPEAHSALEVSDEVLIVTCPDKSSLEQAKRTVELAKDLRLLILGVVLNKVQDKHYELSNEFIECTLGIPIIAEIPHDEHVPHSQHLKHPVVYAYPNSPSAKAFEKLAFKLMDKEYHPSFQNEALPTKDKLIAE
ncbi:MAG: P-loop NTPase [Nanoarchaeota archaeon]